MPYPISALKFEPREKEFLMEEKNARKSRWSVLAFAMLLTVCGFGLAGCPDDDDDDFEFKAAVVAEQ